MVSFTGLTSEWGLWRILMHEMREKGTNCCPVAGTAHA